MTAPHECYVYYRVAPAHDRAARTALATMLDELAADGVHGRAFVKVAEPLLWMEIYSGVTDPDRFIERLDALAERHGLLRYLADGQRRHVEQFVAMQEP